ncbi:Gfo/Idh/MocA family oxidoreductase [Raineyella sp. LH-20]|uniref:Gfo/Idh/MocA family protein n=1 Tax=Raineyella sp. LH-20 TaxID=3081204 RepID=UPI0029537A42|nr:Gfo/Idh/MocA family oxidoreductase [Raineyella sp. LH-20]WOP19055.1 Gfo/Idh/MocA family oxidoreductase [Raineyella sp. LH-20]
MKVGCIGLGDIARKAYLPVLGSLAEVELHLQTRSPSTLTAVADGHHLPGAQRHADLDSLLDAGLDAAFVHAPTETHPAIVTRLLDAGIATYVDKPLAYDLATCRELVTLAEQRSTSLMVGFNRRFAPGYASCHDHPRDLIVLQKNRPGPADEVRRTVFDDFIHVVDTLRFLVPGEVDEVTVNHRVREGRLEHVVLQLSGAGFTALGVMNRVAGVTEEVLEVSGGGRKRVVRDLADVIDHPDGLPTVHRRPDWVPVPRQRGLEQAVLTFLGAVREDVVLSARNALATHALCEQIVARAGESYDPRFDSAATASGDGTPSEEGRPS